jgi:hypothetical protein
LFNFSTVGNNIIAGRENTSSALYGELMQLRKYTQRNFPARFVWLKVVSIDRSLLKREAPEIFS